MAITRVRSAHFALAPVVISLLIGCNAGSNEELGAASDLALVPTPTPTPVSTPAPTPASTMTPSASPEPTPQATTTPSTGTIIGDCQPSDLEIALWQSHNSARAESRYCDTVFYEAVPAVDLHCKLQDAAENHSTDMAVQDYFAHEGLDGSRFWDRTSAVGYENFAQGENIAAGYNSVATVMTGWINSPGHCRNLMGATHTEMGASKVDATGATFSSYWTVIFGRD